MKKRSSKKLEYVECRINGILTKVYLKDDDFCGGSFTTQANGDRVIYLQRYDNWPQMVSVLLHEIVEMTATYLGMRYFRNRHHTGLDSVCFFWTHEEFSEVMAHSGEAMADILPDFARLWKQAGKKKT